MSRASILVALSISCGGAGGAPPGSGDPGGAAPGAFEAPAPGAAHEPAAAPAAEAPAAEPPGPAAAPAGGDGPPILAAHNALRARHCAPPLAWSKELEDGARRWAQELASRGCAFDHDPDTRHGENLAYFRPAGSRGPEEVAAIWHAEVDRYDFRAARFSFEAGHFTQLVWASSRRLGCATVDCGGGSLWVCRYDPPGNVQGQFSGNVKPASCRR
ncbi:MAG TPA: CAP family protein [Kofleriaceae bacterium]|nr:CAP family protein [Kofleriaceae bacterium]